MGLIVLEAALALVVLIFLIWWTMFSGRRGGELRDDAPDEAEGEVSSPDQPPERGGTRNDIG